MKSTRGSIFLFFVVAAVEKDSDAAYKYGPEHCVQLTRSKEGTCVIATNCPTDSIGNFTFDFLCSDGAGGQVIHSFGTGGFLDEETFDTGVSCHTCEPAEGGVLLTADSEEKSTAAPAEPEEAVPPKSASFYGPGSCVASYRSPTGTCIVETRCKAKEEELKEYNVGLTCIEAEGSQTRHLFGVNSFDPEETFDTLIPCKLCLGLDGEAIVAQNLTALAKSVSSLAEGIEEVKKEVAEIKEKLTKKDDSAEADSPAPAPAPASADGEGEGEGEDADAFLSRKAKKGRRTRKSHARVHHARKSQRKAQYLTEDRVDDDTMEDSGESIDVDPDVDPDLELDSDA